MAEQKGLLKTCDRCGAQIFLKYKGTDSLDGGYTKRDNFEATPDGWDYCNVDHGYKALCPACAKRWAEICTEFMAGRM